MSLLNFHGINNIEGAVDPEPLEQDNWEVIAKYLLKRSGSLDTTALGPPTSGTYELNHLWFDSAGAIWQCTVAGTPGTWKQIAPAAVSAFPSGSKPTGYWIVRSDAWFTHFRWDGSNWIAAFYVWNADQSKWHQVTITGAAGAEQLNVGPGETLT